MIIILNAQVAINEWMTGAPLQQLDLMDFRSDYMDLKQASMATFIILMDYENDQFRIMKDRQTGLDLTLPMRNFLMELDRMNMFMNFNAGNFEA